MIAVITADIVNSTQNEGWKEVLQATLSQFGTILQDWNIYRGDSFQLRISDPSQALYAAVLIKATILQLKDLDVRMAIGIGDEQIQTEVVTQNTGSAYINSGRLFEEMDTHLVIKTPWSSADEGLNAGLNLLTTIIEQWTPIMSNYIHTRMTYNKASQSELATRLQTSQSNVSRTLARAYWQPIEQYLNYFSTYINSLL